MQVPLRDGSVLYRHPNTQQTVALAQQRYAEARPEAGVACAGPLNGGPRVEVLVIAGFMQATSPAAIPAHQMFWSVDVVWTFWHTGGPVLGLTDLLAQLGEMGGGALVRQESVLVWSCPAC